MARSRPRFLQANKFSFLDKKIFFDFLDSMFRKKHKKLQIVLFFNSFLDFVLNNVSF